MMMMMMTMINERTTDGTNRSAAHDDDGQQAGRRRPAPALLFGHKSAEQCEPCEAKFQAFVDDRTPMDKLY